MPYLILIFGVIAGIYVFLRFFVKATPELIRHFFLICTVIAFSAVLLFFALTGRIMIAIALLVLSIPFIIAHLKEKSSETEDTEDE